MGVTLFIIVHIIATTVIAFFFKGSVEGISYLLSWVVCFFFMFPPLFVPELIVTRIIARLLGMVEPDRRTDAEREADRLDNAAMWEENLTKKAELRAQAEQLRTLDKIAKK